MFVSNGSDGFHRKDFLTPYPTWRIFLSVPRIEHGLFHRNLFLSNASDGFHQNNLLPLSRKGWNFSNYLTNRHRLLHRNRFVSDGSDRFHWNYSLSPSTVNSPLQKRESTGASFLYWLDWKSKHFNWNVNDWKATQPSLRVFSGKLSKWEPCKSCKIPYKSL